MSTYIPSITHIVNTLPQQYRHIPNYLKVALQNNVFATIFTINGNLLELNNVDVFTILSKLSLAQMYEFLCVLIPLTMHSGYNSLEWAIQCIDEEQCKCLSDLTIDFKKTAKIIVCGMVELVREDYSCKVHMENYYKKAKRNKVFDTIFCAYLQKIGFTRDDKKVRYACLLLNCNVNVFEKLEQYSVEQLFEFLNIVCNFMSEMYERPLKLSTELVGKRIKYDNFDTLLKENEILRKKLEAIKNTINKNI
jgi:hypothetical protein